MSMFEKDSAGNLRPKAWTDRKPPAPYDRKVFSPLFVTGLAVMAAGVVLAVTGAASPVVWSIVFSFGVGWTVTYCLGEIRRYWHEMRWMYSPAPKGTLDDEGIL
jgi:hypothetical protein